MLRPKSYNLLTKGAKQYLKVKTDKQLRDFLRIDGKIQMKGDLIDKQSPSEAQAYLRVAPLGEIPKYINHPSPIVQSIIKQRLSK